MEHRPLTIEEFAHPINYHIAPIFASDGEKTLACGTVVLIAPGLAITAKHVIEYINREFSINPHGLGNVTLDIYILQTQTGRVWYLNQFFYWAGTDIAYLSIKPRNIEAENYEIPRLPMTVDPPVKGEEITALGYPSTKINNYIIGDKVTKINLSITPTGSVGKVLDIYYEMRDNVMINFPSISVDTKFTAGMSGGAIFNSQKKLCALVCAGGIEEIGVNLWASFIIPIKLVAQDPIPKGLVVGHEYKALDLAKSGYLNVEGHNRIEFFKHDNGSDGIRRYHY